MFNLKIIHEHFNDEHELGNTANFEPILFQKNSEKKCVEFISNYRLVTNYYVGVDWVKENESAVYVQPKLNKESKDETDYLKMLFSALQHADIAEKHTKELFEIKFDVPLIEITQEQDLLTPLLVVQFLQVVKNLVRKGLKKSYYRVENNLNARTKGRILVSKTLKQNILKNKLIHTVCQYEEFGFNGLENRLLKKTLLFVQRYLPTLKHLGSDIYATETFNYILPVFEQVDSSIELNEIKFTKTNIFYKEYEEALRLAKLILKRFGYNLTATQRNDKVKVPPFWIDMSKLFELYVLGLLKEKFGLDVCFQQGGKYGDTDYLITKAGNKMIVDAKYKPQYSSEYVIADIRQLSGYSRDKGILKKLGVDFNVIVDCLIIYPDQSAKEKLSENLRAVPIEEFTQFFKTAVKLPTLKFCGIPIQ